MISPCLIWLIREVLQNKMKTGILLCVFIVSVNSVAQAQLTDSLYLNSAPHQQEIKTRLWDTPLFYVSQPIAAFTATQLDVTRKKYAFKRVQTAEERTDYRFLTEGVFNVSEQLRLFGDFTFVRAQEEGLGYNFSSERTENQHVLTPNYFYAPKKGSWSLQRYSLNGGISYRFKNNLLAGGKLHYESKKDYRKTDPRPQIKSGKIGGEIHAGYAFLKHRIIGLAGIYLKTETGSIIYMDDSQNAEVYTDTYTRFSSGYGRVVYNSSYSSHLFKTVDHKVGLGYQYIGNHSMLNFLYQYQQSKRNFYQRDANGNIYFDEDLILYRYEEEQQEWRIGYERVADAHRYMFALAYKQEEGSNFSVEENGQNYAMQCGTLSIEGKVIREQGAKVIYDLGTAIHYESLEYIDHLGYVDKTLGIITWQVYYNTDVLQTTHGTFNLTLQLSGEVIPDEHLLYSAISNDSTFASGVILPDHAYDVTAKLSPAFRMAYTRRLPEQKSLSLFLRGQTIHHINDSYKKYYAIPTGTSASWNAGIILKY